MRTCRCHSLSNCTYLHYYSQSHYLHYSLTTCTTVSLPELQSNYLHLPALLSRVPPLPALPSRVPPAATSPVVPPAGTSPLFFTEPDFDGWAALELSVMSALPALAMPLSPAPAPAVSSLTLAARLCALWFWLLPDGLVVFSVVDTDAELLLVFASVLPKGRC